MGVNIRNCYNGSCTSFNDFRFYLANIAGYKVVKENLKTSFGTDYVCRYVKLNKNINYEGALLGDWTVEPIDALLYLFHHSDCEGYIRLHQMLPLADALENLLSKVESEYYEDLTKKFITGLRKSHKEGKDIKFC